MADLELDAGCEPGLPRLDDVLEDHVPWLVLFASVMYVRDENGTARHGPRTALEARAAEWRDLFGEGEPWHTTKG